MRKLTLFITLLLLCWSCYSVKNELSDSDIDLSGNIDKTTPKLSLNSYLENINIIPLETSKDFLLSYFSFVSAKDNELVLNDKENVYFIDKRSGEFLSKFNRKGNGAGEYIQIFNAEMLRDGTVLILDPTKKRLSNYNRNGDFLSTVKNDSLGIVKQLYNGAYIVNYSPHIITSHSIGIYDKSWNLVRQSIPKDNDTEFRMLHYDALNNYNGENLFRQSPLGDTIYRITYETEKPYIVLNKGNLKAPADIYTDLNKLNSESHKYITGDHAIVVGGLMFLRYAYNKGYYSDIWDIENSNLIYRGVFTREGGIYGVPLLVDGCEVNVWPSYAEDNRLYVTLSAEEAAKFMPNILEDDNPVILELTFKNKD